MIRVRRSSFESSSRTHTLSISRSEKLMYRIGLVACVLLVVGSVADMTFADSLMAERLSLWNGNAPIDQHGDFEDSDAWITVHRPAKPNGMAAVICPGGGYGNLVKGPEGHGIAKWLNRQGITGIVLEYRLPKGRSFVPLLDAQRAIRIARTNSNEWNLKTWQIGIIGFSAGGHLASTAATHFDAGDKKSNDSIARTSCRPDFAILVYPVITMGDATHSGSRKNLLGDAPDDELVAQFSNERHVSADTPPVFMTHAVDDGAVPVQNSRLFHEACKKRNVPSKLLELPSGGHGLNGYKGPMWDKWQQQAIAWLKEFSE